MKAKVIETGKIVDVIKIPATIVGLEHYWDRKNEKEYSESELDFRVCIQMDDESINPIDWEQRRYEIAKVAMVGVLAFPVVEGVNPNPDVIDVCKLSVKLADALIEELKRNKNQN